MYTSHILFFICILGNILQNLFFLVLKFDVEIAFKVKNNAIIARLISLPTKV